MVPGVLLAGVKNTVGTGEIEMLGLGNVWLVAELLGRLIGDEELGLLAWGGAVFWQATNMLRMPKNAPDLKMYSIER
jgi:hypothetical protein